MINLQNKKVLLFIPRGKGIYGTGVSNELESRGATVTVYDERPSTSTLSKIAIRIAKNLFKLYLYRYFRKIVNQNKNIDFDYVFIVRGEGLTPEIVQMLRKSYGNAVFILYLWDSLISNNISSVFPYFDKIFSFDKEDVSRHSELSFRPLFFLPNYSSIADIQQRDIDFIFIGKVHSDRFSIIKDLHSFFSSTNLKTFYYFYFPSKLLFLKKKITDPAFKNSKISDFKYKMITAEQVSYYMSHSKASLDIEAPGQTGLTMRTIEVLGAKRKLITTNKTIASYDFFDKRNIMIIDRINPKIDLDFIQSSYVEIPNEIYDRYSLKGWIEEIFA